MSEPTVPPMICRIGTNERRTKGRVRIVCPDGQPHHTTVTYADTGELIHTYEVDVHIGMGEPATASLRVLLPEVDMTVDGEILEEQVRLDFHRLHEEDVWTLAEMLYNANRDATLHMPHLFVLPFDKLSDDVSEWYLLMAESLIRQDGETVVLEVANAKDLAEDA